MLSLLLAEAPPACAPSGWCQELPERPQDDLFAAWGFGGDVWAAGDRGTLLHRAGGSWAEVPSGTEEPLRGLWGAAASDLWAVGEATTR